MLSWKLLTLWGCLLLAMTLRAQGLFDAPAIFNQDTLDERYNLEFTVQPPAKANTRGVQLAFEWENTEAYTLLTLTQTRISVSALRAGKTMTTLAKDYAFAPAGARIAVLRRDARVLVLVNDALILQGELPRGPGQHASLRVGQGWTAPAPSVQVMEPVAFSDDFMRTENQFWHAQRGQWSLKSAWDNDIKSKSLHLVSPEDAQNPFAYVGRAPEAGAAWCTATVGKPSWDDYTMTAAVQPPTDGALGLLVNMTGPDSGLVIRWSPASDRGPHGNTLALCRLENGKLSYLSESPGGTIPGQWFNITVTSRLQEGVQVAIDNHVRIPFTPVTPRRGSIGLYSESRDGAVFDDITAYGQGFNMDLLAERQVLAIGQRFKDDQEMKAWARTQSEWTPWPRVANQWVHRFDYFGDQWLYTAVKPQGTGAGELVLALQTDGQELTIGYRAEVTRAEDGTVRYALYRNADPLGTPTAGEACTAGEDYTFRFLHDGQRLRLQRDGETVLEAEDAQPLPGLRPAYRASGSFASARDVVVMGRQVRDYTFATAPVDWLGDGTWLPSIRWSCAPQWSFLGGWSRGDAVLWHKERFSGDQTFEAFLGIKMEYPRQRDIYENRYRGIAVTICGDGRDPRNGYAVVFGAPDAQGKPNRRTVLLRNGVEVAAVPQRMPDKTYGHHTWFDMVLAKRGDSITFQVTYLSKNMWWQGDPGRVVTVNLSYKDPEPLAGGIPAIWAADNGITVARARLFYAAAPQPRTEPLVAISEPWVPDWHEVGKTLALPFTGLCATDGKPVSLSVQAVAVPEGEAPRATVNGNTVTFTPTKTGDYWYSIRAVDGEYRSPAVHLSLPVFDPALGRDDTHAVVLYRFDEGTGTVVHDRGVAPAADLTIPKDANARWLPGQGLFFNGPAPLMTKSNVPKLMALAKAKAGTIELWQTAATTDPPSNSRGCWLTWGGVGAEKRNFTFSHHWYTPMLLGPGTYYQYREQRWEGPHWGEQPWTYDYNLHLQHIVLAWDSTKARLYIDGKERPSLGNLSAFMEKWTPDAPLLLGNLGTLDENFIGTYYLVAIHDRALSAEDVLRHYQAGPAGK